MLAYTYVERGKFALLEKPRPVLLDGRDAIVRVTLASICTSDLHIKHGSVPRAVPGVTVGHEMVGVVEAVGPDVRKVRPGDRVTVNVETFCGECFFCKNGWVNNCTDPNGGWALGCRIDGGQAEYVRVPYADCGLDRIPDGVSDVQALLVGDLLATGYWAADISEVRPGDTALIIGARPTGLCTLECLLPRAPAVIVCEADAARRDFVRRHWPEVLVTGPEGCGLRARPQRPRRGRRGARGRGHARHLHGLGLRAAQRRGYRRGALRRAAGPAPAGHVRQEPHLPRPAA
ncbi:MAG: alcohol dehydrogenase catalytic domain-containing protein [Oscillospiraceae bacterium]